MDELRKKSLEKQGYRVVGNHSAIKPCLWCKKAIRGEDVCYKKTFYGINTWRCIQASVSLDVCNHACVFCWRDINVPSRLSFTSSQKCWRDVGAGSNKFEVVDEPAKILDGFMIEQKKALEGFYGYAKVDKKRLDEAMNPKHVALSLTGETCMYPKLPEMVEEIRKRGMTSFVVSNGTIPSMVKKLIKVKPTQFYITFPAPDKETYVKVCNPLMNDGWERINESLQMMEKFERGTIRLTLVKGVNMLDAEGYAKMLKDVGFKFLELKAGMPIGYARHRIAYTQMPTHDEIKCFAEKIAKVGGFKVIDEKINSRVVLLMREDFDGRVMEFD